VSGRSRGWAAAGSHSRSCFSGCDHERPRLLPRGGEIPPPPAAPARRPPGRPSRTARRPRWRSCPRSSPSAERGSLALRREARARPRSGGERRASSKSRSCAITCAVGGSRDLRQSGRAPYPARKARARIGALRGRDSASAASSSWCPGSSEASCGLTSRRPAQAWSRRARRSPRHRGRPAPGQGPGRTRRAWEPRATCVSPVQARAHAPWAPDRGITTARTSGAERAAAFEQVTDGARNRSGRARCRGPSRSALPTALDSRGPGGPRRCRARERARCAPMRPPPARSRSSRTQRAIGQRAASGRPRAP